MGWATEAMVEGLDRPSTRLRAPSRACWPEMYRFAKVVDCDGNRIDKVLANDLENAYNESDNGGDK